MKTSLSAFIPTCPDGKAHQQQPVGPRDKTNPNPLPGQIIHSFNGKSLVAARLVRFVSEFVEALLEGRHEVLRVLHPARYPHETVRDAHLLSGGGKKERRGGRFSSGMERSERGGVVCMKKRMYGWGDMTVEQMTPISRHTHPSSSHSPRFLIVIDAFGVSGTYLLLSCASACAHCGMYLLDWDGAQYTSNTLKCQKGFNNVLSPPQRGYPRFRHTIKTRSGRKERNHPSDWREANRSRNKRFLLEQEALVSPHSMAAPETPLYGMGEKSVLSSESVRFWVCAVLIFCTALGRVTHA